MIGRTVGGYRIESELGRGGQAVVYRATQLSLQRLVALKVVSPQFAADEGFLDRFKREGISAASLDHTNVIPVYESGEAEGVAYLAMKLVDGPTLDQLIRRQGALPVHRTLGILRQVADALDYAGRRGLVHRDVKPANVLLGPGDHAYLSDFGLTKALEGARLTRTGVWMGTLEYIAPEQIRAGEVTAAADRYALAVMAYEALTGKAPFIREDRTALLYAHLNDMPPAPSTHRPELGPQVDQVMARGLAKDPAERHASAREFVDALEAAVVATPGAAAAAGPARPTEVGAVPTTPPATASPPATAPPPATTPGAPGSAPPGPTVVPSTPPVSDPPPPTGPGREGGGGRPRWLIPAIAGGGALAALVVILVVVFASGGGGGRTVTTVVPPPSTDTLPTDTGATTAPTTPSTPTAPTTTFPIGAVLPAALPGFGLSATEPRPANVELPAGFEFESAQAVRGNEVALLTGIAVPAGTDVNETLADLEGQIGLQSVGEVPLTGATGRLYRPGGANLLAFAKGDRIVLIVSALRSTVTDLGQEVSAALP
ncbi:MAG: serine/threonine protein kinase [Thermoleophilia bacterium]|nr:serine/threonine protein kinase [Thermoleophilia bacterium]